MGHGNCQYEASQDSLASELAPKHRRLGTLFGLRKATTPIRGLDAMPHDGHCPEPIPVTPCETGEQRVV